MLICFFFGQVCVGSFICLNSWVGGDQISVKIRIDIDWNWIQTPRLTFQGTVIKDNEKATFVFLALVIQDLVFPLNRAFIQIWLSIYWLKNSDYGKEKQPKKNRSAFQSCSGGSLVFLTTRLSAAVETESCSGYFAVVWKRNSFWHFFLLFSLEIGYSDFEKWVKSCSCPGVRVDNNPKNLNLKDAYCFCWKDVKAVLFQAFHIATLCNRVCQVSSWLHGWSAGIRFVSFDTSAPGFCLY